MILYNNTNAMVHISDRETDLFDKEVLPGNTPASYLFILCQD